MEINKYVCSSVGRALFSKSRCRWFEPIQACKSKKGNNSPPFLIDLVVINYFFFEIIDQTPLTRAIAVPISSCTDESVASPFITTIAPMKVSACLTTPKICSLVILKLIKGLCQSINIGKTIKLFFGLMSRHFPLIEIEVIQFLQEPQKNIC